MEKCNKELAKRIFEKIGSLKTDPVPHKSVRVVGEERNFRIRLGDYRIIYEINWNLKVLLITKIDKRARVY